MSDELRSETKRFFQSVATRTAPLILNDEELRVRDFLTIRRARQNAFLTCRDLHLTLKFSDQSLQKDLFKGK